MAISRRGILPDIEFTYELKKLNPAYLKRDSWKEYFESHKEKYGDQYSHLTIMNNGNGKARKIDVAYNWDVNGNLGGLSRDILPPNVFMIYEDYLFPGFEQIDVPAVDFGSDVFEDAKRMLVRVKYKDCMGGSHCKCALFNKNDECRGFYKINEFDKCCTTRTMQIFMKLFGKCNFEDGLCSMEDISCPE